MNSETSQNITATPEPRQVILPTAIERCVRHELHHVRSHWWWFLLLGSLLLVCGTLAIAFPLFTFITSLFVVSFLSILLLIAGVATLISAFWTGKWGGFLVNILVGLLYLAAGFIVAENPNFSLRVITFFVALSFMVMGIFRILAAMMIRFPQWGWTLLNGCVTFLVGLVIYRHLSEAPWVLGLLVGLEMLFNGWAWVMLALEIKRIPAESAT